MAQNNAKEMKEDALEMAHFLYDLYKESQDDNAKIENGQNNANQNDDAD